MSGHKPKKVYNGHHDGLVERLQARGFTLKGLIVELAERGLMVDHRAVWECVHGQNLTLKKRWWLASGIVRTPRRRRQWVKHQGRVDARSPVLLEEKWTRTNMAPQWDWSPSGIRPMRSSRAAIGRP